ASREKSPLEGLFSFAGDALSPRVVRLWAGVWPPGAERRTIGLSPLWESAMYRLPILICLLAVAAPAFPDEGEAGRAPEAGDGRIYRMTDGQGRVIFTDSPPPGAAAEEVHQSRPNTLPPPPRQRLENRRANEPQPDAFKGYTLSISAPAHEQTFQNPQEPIAVQVSLTPPLQGEHSLRVL